MRSRKVDMNIHDFSDEKKAIKPTKPDPIPKAKAESLAHLLPEEASIHIKGGSSCLLVSKEKLRKWLWSARDSDMFIWEQTQYRGLKGPTVFVEKADNFYRKEVK